MEQTAMTHVVLESSRPSFFRRTAFVAYGLAAVCIAGGAGCVSVKAPERITINRSPRPEPVDSGRVPQTSNHEQARMELNKAYQNIQYLENQNRKLADDAQEYRRERDECRRGGRDGDDD